MNILVITCFITLCNAYILIISHHNYSFYKTVECMQTRDKYNALLEGLLAYSIAYYKQHKVLIPKIISVDCSHALQASKAKITITMPDKQHIEIVIKLYKKAYLVAQASSKLELKDTMLTLLNWSVTSEN